MLKLKKNILNFDYHKSLKNKSNYCKLLLCSNDFMLKGKQNINK